MFEAGTARNYVVPGVLESKQVATGPQPKIGRAEETGTNGTWDMPEDVRGHDGIEAPRLEQ